MANGSLRARVTLTGSVSHNWKGRTFRRAEPQIISNASDIKYYQSQAGFDVMLIEGKAKAAIPDVESRPSGANDFNEAELKKMKKAELIDIADALGVDSDGTVGELISAILENQEE